MTVPGKVVAACLFALVLGATLAAASVAPELQQVYDQAKASGTFECLDKSKKIAFEKVNDDYCDCADGSDEPATSACAMIWGGHLVAKGNVSTFKCANTEFFEESIPSHWVNDGLCDCCDGSDEPSGLTKCPNNCGQAARERVERQKRDEAMRKAAAKVKANMNVKAAATRKEVVSSIPKLRSELQALEDELAAMEKLVEKTQAEEDAKRVEAGKRHLEWDARRGELTKGCISWRRTGNCDPLGPREEYYDRDCLSVITHGSSGYCECGEAEAPADPTESSHTDDVSGDSADSLDDEDGDESRREAVVRNLALYNFTCDHVDFQCAYVCRNNGAAGVDDDGVEPLAAHEFELKEATEARTRLAEVKGKVESTAEKLRVAEEYQATEPSVGDLLRTLEKQSFRMDFQGYTYELRLFEGAWQNPRGGSGGPSLGKWGSFAENTYSTWAKDKYDYSRMLFDRGTNCFNGIVRSTEVQVVCGAENKLVHVEEPSMCRYKMVFQTPALCD